ncbi:hypothetical protein [Parendozoicomonas callyspongiae]|nr:hypothetical protein [Sansalvadorimonas sp. 2012CJ34-2]
MFPVAEGWKAKTVAAIQLGSQKKAKGAAGVDEQSLVNFKG